MKPNGAILNFGIFLFELKFEENNKNNSIEEMEPF